MRWALASLMLVAGCGMPGGGGGAGDFSTVGGDCTNGVKNGDETDVDCGGATCAKCADGKMCLGGGDCQSGDCFNNACKPGSPDMGAPDDMPMMMGGDMAIPMENDLAMLVAGDMSLLITSDLSIAQKSDMAVASDLSMAQKSDLSVPPARDMAMVPGGDLSLPIDTTCTFDDPNSTFDNCTVGP